MSFLSSLSCLYFDGNPERQVRKHLISFLSLFLIVFFSCFYELRTTFSKMVGFARVIGLFKSFFNSPFYNKTRKVL